jgi:hypothetical protein
MPKSALNQGSHGGALAGGELLGLDQQLVGEFDRGLHIQEPILPYIWVECALTAGDLLVGGEEFLADDGDVQPGRQSAFVIGPLIDIRGSVLGVVMAWRKLSSLQSRQSCRLFRRADSGVSEESR